MSMAQDQVMRAMVERLCVQFNKRPEEITAGTRFIEDLKAKSTSITQLINYLEDEFEVQISYMEFRRHPTLASAAEYVARLCE
jgi:acyl carrier protein